MTNLCEKNSTTIGTAILVFILIGLMSYGQQEHRRFIAEAGEGVCAEYDQADNTINVKCNSTFQDVVQTINDQKIVQNLGNGEYVLNATLEIADGVTFEMTSSNVGDNLQYLKIAGANGVIVHGRILIDGVKITSWDVFEEDVIQQDMNGTVPRGYIQFAASEGSQITNSDFGFLGDVEPGRRGFDLFGVGERPSHDMLIKGSRFHDMWMAFFSEGAYNITIDGNEYYNNIKYALDPHTVSYNMNITNNWLHHNPTGAICSDRCYNILIEGNLVEDNVDHGIYFSRNMHDSIARNNHVSNTTSGITVSESPNNQIYNNTIEGATSYGIRLFNPPEPPYDGFTESNLVYNNSIIDSENGIVATRSHDNVVENTTFSDIESSEYLLSGNSSLMIRGQIFDNTLISQVNSQIDSHIEIIDSGMIEVTEGVIEDEGREEDEGEGDLYNTNIEPYWRTLSDGNDITVNSS